MGIILKVLGYVSDFFSPVVEFLGAILDRITDLLDTLVSVFADTPTLVSKLGLMFDGFLWFLPDPARFVIYAAVFGLLIWGILKLVLRIFRG